MDFYPRYAKLRHYRYYLKSRDLDVKNITNAASVFSGKHNFTNFAKIEHGKNPIRTIENIVFKAEDDFLIIDFYAQTFLWNQIRRIISSFIKIGKGKLDINEIKNALEKPDKKKDFGVAPAEPLILMDVLYNFEFCKNKNQILKLKELENRIITNIKNR